MRPTNAAIVLFHHSVLLVKYIIMESTVSSSITSHIAILNRSNPHQWAYKKGHSTELLLVKMTEVGEEHLTIMRQSRSFSLTLKKRSIPHLTLCYYKAWESPGTFGCGSKIILLTAIKLLHSVFLSEPFL